MGSIGVPREGYRDVRCFDARKSQTEFMDSYCIDDSGTTFATTSDLIASKAQIITNWTEDEMPPAVSGSLNHVNGTVVPNLCWPEKTPRENMPYTTSGRLTSDNASLLRARYRNRI